MVSRTCDNCGKDRILSALEALRVYGSIHKEPVKKCLECFTTFKPRQGSNQCPICKCGETRKLKWQDPDQELVSKGQLTRLADKDRKRYVCSWCGHIPP